MACLWTRAHTLRSRRSAPGGCPTRACWSRAGWLLPPSPAAAAGASPQTSARRSAPRHSPSAVKRCSRPPTAEVIPTDIPVPSRRRGRRSPSSPAARPGPPTPTPAPRPAGAGPERHRVGELALPLHRERHEPILAHGRAVEIEAQVRLQLDRLHHRPRLGRVGEAGAHPLKVEAVTALRRVGVHAAVRHHEAAVRHPPQFVRPDPARRVALGPRPEASTLRPRSRWSPTPRRPAERAVPWKCRPAGNSSSAHQPSRASMTRAKVLGRRAKATAPGAIGCAAAA